MKKLSTLIFCLLLLNAVALQAQQLSPSSLQQLNATSQRENARHEAFIQQVNPAMLQRLGMPNFNASGVLSRMDGQSMLVGFDPFGMPLFNAPNSNANAAISVTTDSVRPGGGLGLTLTGNARIIYEWDGGIVRTTHQEFGSRASMQDAAAVNSSHATHVAGTMMAAGISPTAQGMAYAATLRVYDFDNDVAEMAVAAANGALISNHSYGLTSGWNFTTNPPRWYGNTSVSTTEDFKFGWYNSRAADVDAITYSNPYYLPVIAAGNDRNDEQPGNLTHEVLDNNFDWVISTDVRDPDGPYDCIPPMQTAKNSLTIGAVNIIARGNQDNPNNIVMSGFSSWGPTDDGRIKPDLVAPGVTLFSTTNGSDVSYGNSSGTSMATPVATGSLALNQQQYKEKFGVEITSAMLKALAINTAFEAGANPGPDYSFGWGLLNTAAVARAIQQDGIKHQMLENTLANNETQTYQIMVQAGQVPKLSMVWTDPAATPFNTIGTVLNNTTPRLRNDLDVRLTSPTNVTYLPWILNPASPANAATKGDNTLDNVEQVEGATGAGVWTITVTHKGSLVNGQQAYAIAVENAVEATANTFTGSGSWNNASNWNLGQVPSSVDSVSIAANKIVNVTANASVGSIYLPASSQLVLGDGITLSITHHAEIDGTITGLGTTLLSSGNNHWLWGSGTLQNLTVAQATTLQSPMSVNGNLTLNATLNTSGNQLTLASDPTSDGALFTNQNNPLQGATNVKVQNRITGDQRWMLLSTPLANQTLQSWMNNSAPSTAGIDIRVNQPGPLAASAVYFTGGSTWTNATALSQTVPAGSGVRVLVRDAFLSTNQNGNGVGVLSNVGAVVVGAGANGNAATPFTFSGLTDAGLRWNLVGNPYPATIDWQSGAWTKTNLENTIWTWDYDRYAMYNATNQTSINGQTRYLAKGQGFFVRATAGTPTLQVSEAAKVTEAVDPKNNTNAGIQRLKLALQQNNRSDETALVLMNGATLGLDPGLDNAKMSGSGLNLSSLISQGSGALAIQSLPNADDLPSITTLPLRVQASTGGNFNLMVREMPASPSLTVYLHDALASTYTQLSANSSYPFSLDADSASAGSLRFSVVLYNSNAVTTSDLKLQVVPTLQLYPNPAQGIVHLQCNEHIIGVRVLGLSGRQVYAPYANSRINLSGLQSGLYVVEVRTLAGVVKKKLVVE